HRYLSSDSEAVCAPMRIDAVIPIIATSTITIRPAGHRYRFLFLLLSRFACRIDAPQLEFHAPAGQIGLSKSSVNFQESGPVTDGRAAALAPDPCHRVLPEVGTYGFPLLWGCEYHFSILTGIGSRISGEARG